MNPRAMKISFCGREVSGPALAAGRRWRLERALMPANHRAPKVCSRTPQSPESHPHMSLG